jgi:hypothetical protein
VGNQPEWKVENSLHGWWPQSEKLLRNCLVDMPKQLKWLDTSQDALFNRLRTGGDQIFPFGWAMVLQKAAGVTYVADAFSRQTDNGIHIPGADVKLITRRS